MIIETHVVAGLVALAAGGGALAVKKGGGTHRRSGWFFVAAMVAMTSTAVIVATGPRPNPGNVIAGLLTLYLVITGATALRQSLPATQGWHVGLALAVAAVAAAALALGLAASQRQGGSIDGIPAPAFFMFACVGALAAIGDARLSFATVRAPSQRVMRHLWRMGFALWIATMSFFIGQARHFPAALRESGLLAVPVLLVAGLVVYWLFRTWRRGRSVRRFPDAGQALHQSRSVGEA